MSRNDDNEDERQGSTYNQIITRSKAILPFAGLTSFYGGWKRIIVVFIILVSFFIFSFILISMFMNTLF